MRVSKAEQIYLGILFGLIAIVIIEQIKMAIW